MGYRGDLSELHVSTIHGLCNRILLEFRHHTPLGTGYETLDELTELLFLFDHFGDIVGSGDPPFLGRWTTQIGRAIESLRSYFDKITEELVDPDLLVSSGDDLVSQIGAAYGRYQVKLFEQKSSTSPISRPWFMISCPTRRSAISSLVGCATCWWMSTRTRTTSRSRY